ncbi:MAG: amino acid ABC transporter substrate-binding protein [Anaerolineae bacterium]|nr:amino acid ABC transporter substrate-binding protein [Anaerolineae bacterium]
MKTKKRFTLLLSIGAAALLIGVVAGIAPASKLAAQGDAPEKIIIGNAIALSGPNAQGAMLSQIPSYDLWAADVNAAGGIYVEEYDTRIPVEILRYDDTSDIGTAIQLTEKLILEDKVHFLLPPWGTASNFAIAPLVTMHQMPVLGCTVGSKQLQEEADQFPYFFTMLNQPTTQGPGLVDLLVELGVETVAVIHHTDLHGIEFAEVTVPLLEDAGIDIVLLKTYPPATEDLSQLLREVQEADPDAFLAFSYPPETFLMTAQMAEIGYHPDLFYATVGIAFPAYRDVFGAEVVEGTMGAGVWNPNVPIEGAQEYFDRHVEMIGQEPDRWASAACYASGQVLQQAIEMAGTLDPEAVRDAMASGEFETILGTVHFENQFNQTYPGTVGQWQNGEFEIVSPADQRTADPIYPRSSE